MREHQYLHQLQYHEFFGKLIILLDGEWIMTGFQGDSSSPPTSSFRSLMEVSVSENRLAAIDESRSVVVWKNKQWQKVCFQKDISEKSPKGDLAELGMLPRDVPLSQLASSQHPTLADIAHSVGEDDSLVPEVLADSEQTNVDCRDLRCLDTAVEPTEVSYSENNCCKRGAKKICKYVADSPSGGVGDEDEKQNFKKRKLADKTVDVLKEEPSSGNLQSSPARVSGRIKSVLVEDNALIAVDEGGGIITGNTALPLGIGIKVTKVAVGKESFMALTSNGEVMTWGSGMRGQLGNGCAAAVDHPELVSYLQGVQIKDIASGGWHCLALSVNGDVYAWGWNDQGQLGFPSKESWTPGLLPYQHCQCSQLENERSYPHLMSSDDHNTKSTLQQNSQWSSEIVNVQFSPKLLDFWKEEVIIKRIACADRHSAVLLDDGTAWTMGWNRYGQLGVGDTKPRYRPNLVPLHHVSEIIAGGWSTIFLCKKLNNTKLL